jgi:hypothetical protein
MPVLTEDDKKRLFMTLDLHTKQNESIERALYGDKANKVKGLLERTQHIESWITASKVKIAYISGGVAVFVVLLKLCWEWLSGKKP